MTTRIVPLDIARAITLAVACAALLLLLMSGPGTRLGAWSWQNGIAMVRWAFYMGAAAGISAAALAILLLVPKFRFRPWVPVLALLIALVAIVPPLLLLSNAKAVPRIHDVTTDMADPPAFVALMEERRKAPNGFAYGGEAIAAQQRAGYPDLKALVMKAAPREVMQRVIDEARSMGWEVVASDAAAGRVEATDTTRWFGFKDDIVVRVRAEGEGSRVDVRSVSRVGLSDLGANAIRIRSFLGRLA
ncbi:MAG: DUF1499 domain-containing protein [Usitatibacter sp.]